MSDHHAALIPRLPCGEREKGNAHRRAFAQRVSRRRGYQLLLVRAGLGGLVVAMLSIDGAPGPLALPAWWWAAGLALVAAVDLVFLTLTRFLPWSRALLHAQVSVDLLLAVALVYLTGGVNSVFSFLPVSCVVTAAVVLKGYAAVGYASLATVLLAGVSLAYSLSYLGLVRLSWVSPTWVRTLQPLVPRTLAIVAGQGMALHVVAYLGGHLALRLRRETHLKEEILDTIAEGLIVADADLRVVFVNVEALSLLGFQRAEQLVGRRWQDIFRRRGDAQIRQMLAPHPGAGAPQGSAGAPPPSAAAPVCEPGPAATAQAGLPGVLTDEDALVGRSRVIAFDHRDRGRLYLSVKTSPFRRSHDALGGVVAIFHDVTAEKVMEAVQERADRLREISLVAAGIAHELRNPLGAIRGCVQELARIESDNPQARRLAQIVTAETGRLDTIITEFLNFARMRPPRPQAVDLHALIEEVIVLLQADRTLKPIDIETDVPGRLTITADRDQLKQVLLNLARNAVDAMPEGGRLEVTAALVPHLPGGPAQDARASSSTAPTRAVCIEVADTGVGIAPDDIQALFTPFFTTKPAGTGMGLSIVERIVRAHGGHLEVDSQLAAGSTFRVWLPVAPPPPTVPAVPLWNRDNADPHARCVAPFSEGAFAS